jgi:hypothetical protein
MSFKENFCPSLFAFTYFCNSSLVFCNARSLNSVYTSGVIVILVEFTILYFRINSNSPSYGLYNPLLANSSACFTDNDSARSSGNFKVGVFIGTHSEESVEESVEEAVEKAVEEAVEEAPEEAPEEAVEEALEEAVVINSLTLPRASS